MKSKKYGKRALVAKVAVILAALAAFAFMLPASFASNVASSVAGTPESNIASVEVSVDLDHGYITYKGQTVASPSTAVIAPEGADFVFSAAADSDYSLTAVEMVLDGKASPLKKLSDDTYVVGASAVKKGLKIKLSTKKEATDKVAKTKDVADTESKSADSTTSSSAAAADKDASAKKTSYTFEDDSVKVTATLQDASAVPDNAQFKVTPVTASTKGYNYNAYMKALNDQDTGTGENSTYTDQNTLLYDIAFIVDGKEYEPASGSVAVDIQFKKDQLTKDLGVTENANSAIDVTHLELKEAAKKDAATTADATNISAADIKVEAVREQSATVDGTQSAAFTTDSFSIYCLSVAGQQKSWEGSKSFNVSDILTELKDTTHFAIVANTLDADQHIEGNVRVGTFKLNGNVQLNAGGRVYTENKLAALTVMKKVENGPDGNFSFAFFNGGSQIGERFAITTENGVGSIKISRGDAAWTALFSALDSGSAPTLFELDESGTPVENGEANGIYVVGYENEDVVGAPVDQIANTQFDNYIGQFETINGSAVSGSFNQFFGDRPTTTYVGEDFAYGTENGQTGHLLFGADRDFIVQNADSSKFVKVDNLAATISSNLDTAADTSAKLAQAKNGPVDNQGGLNVINLVATKGNLVEDLAAAGFNYESNSQTYYLKDLAAKKQYVLINIDVSQFADSYMLRNNNPFFDGINPQDHYNYLGSHVIYNFVTKKGDGSYEPYTGTVRIDSHSSGLVLAPRATVDQSGNMLEGTIVANAVKHSGQELHKTPIAEGSAYEGSVVITNTATTRGDSRVLPAQLVFSGTKTLVGRDMQQGDTFSFVLKEGDATLETVNSDANGAFAFSTINYEQADVGEHTYTIREVIPDSAVAYDSHNDAIFVLDTDNYSGSGVSLSYGEYQKLSAEDRQKYDVASWTNAGITYDTKVYTVTAKVENAGSNLKVSTQGDAPDALNFTNTFGLSAKAKIRAFKKLSGTTLSAGQFSFELKDATGKVVSTAQNDAEGTIEFDAIEYTTAGLQAALEDGTAVKNDDGSYTFEYTISEVGGGSVSNGVSYDDSIKRVSVTVSQKGQETLGASVVYHPEGATTTNVFNYDGDNQDASKNINTDHAFKFNGGSGDKNAINNWTKLHGGVRQGIVNNVLTDGYPTLKSTGESLAYLFNAQTPGVSDYALNAQGLYAYDTVTGSYSYDSTLDYAHLVDGNFVKLGYAAKAENGNFMPFSEVGSKGDYHFGLETATAFTMPEGGQVNGADMTYSFTGDDDVWVFVDNVLVLDLGGIHDTYGGAINFKTGEVKYDSGTKGKDAKIADLFAAAGETWDATTGTTHTLRIFYFERGKNESNFAATFNLASVATFGNTYEAKGTAQLTATKSFANATSAAPALTTFAFKLTNQNGDLIQTKNANANGKVVFDALPYTAPGTHRYFISEVIPEGAIYSADRRSASFEGITYDATAHLVSVEMVDDGKGNLLPKYTYADGDTASFENSYDAKGELALSGTKRIDTRSLREGDSFTYTVKEGSETVAAGSSDSSGVISFSPINYTLSDVGTHTYAVTEDATDAAAITIDKTTRVITVNVRDAGDGSLSVDAVQGDPQAVDFVNSYAATGELKLAGTKSIDTRALKAGDNFSYVVKEGNETVATGTSDETGVIEFTTIRYTIEDLGQHSYVVTENASSVAGVTSTNASYIVDVTVSDNGDGTLGVAASDNASKLDFVNAYTASGSVTFAGSKFMNGRAFAQGDTYVFNITDTTPGGSGKTWNVTNDPSALAGGASPIQYPTISYTQADAGKTFTYHVTESARQVAGVTVSSESYDVTVNVSDNGDGTLAVLASDNATKLDFTNVYTAKGSTELSGTKTISGREFTSGDTATFTLTAAPGTPMPATSEVSIAPTSGKTAIVNFGRIDYELADVGTYTYTVTETINGMAGTTTAAAQSVTVTVVDNGDGTLAVTKSSNNGANFDLSNEYDAKGSATLAVTKTLTGRAWGAAESFSFGLSGQPGAPMPAVTSTTATQGAPKASFGEIVFGLSDVGKTYVYTINENVPSGVSADNPRLNGTVYDLSRHTASVTVSDNKDGTLVTSVVYDNDSALDSAAFENKYATTAVVLGANKTLSGAQLAGGEFSFTLTGTSENAAETSMTATNAADGTVTFGTLTFDTPGVYEYKIAELAGTSAAYTYDTSVHTARVEVTSDASGALAASVSYDDGSDSVPVFVNSYYEASTTLSLTKYYFGDAAVTFDFTLTAADSNWNARNGAKSVYGSVDKITDNGTDAFSVTVANDTFDANGKAPITFPAISYYQPGEYYYVVSENAKDGYEVDNAEFLVHVSVAEDMSVDTTYAMRYNGDVTDVSASDVAFYNNGSITLGFMSLSAMGYTSGGAMTSVYPKVRKTLDGSSVVDAGAFNFVLSDENDIVLAMGTNDANGEVAFFEEGSTGLSYTSADIGTHKYTITELNDGMPGVTYDTAVIGLTVTIRQDSDGKLVATAAYDINGAATDDPIFANTTEGVDLSLQKVSRMGGEGLDECTYGLWMANANGADVLVAEATTGPDGWMTFKDVHLKQGELYYFKEVEAPTGHKVDPYRTAYFTLDQSGASLVLAENTNDGLHAADNEGE